MTTTRRPGPAPFRTVLELGALIRDTRAARGWTQAELAGRANVGRQWLISVEQGHRSRAEVGLVLRVLSALDIELLAQPASALPTPPPVRAHSASDVDLDALLGDMSDGARDGQS